MRARNGGNLPPVMLKGNLVEVIGREVRQWSPGELMVESSPSRQRWPPCKTNKEMSDEAADAAALTYLLTYSLLSPSLSPVVLVPLVVLVMLMVRVVVWLVMARVLLVTLQAVVLPMASIVRLLSLPVGGVTYHVHVCLPPRAPPGFPFPLPPVRILHPQQPLPSLPLLQATPRPPAPSLVHVLLPPLQDLELGPLPPPDHLAWWSAPALRDLRRWVKWAVGAGRREGVHMVHTFEEIRILTPAKPKEAAPGATMPQVAWKALLRDAVQGLCPSYTPQTLGKWLHTTHPRRGPSAPHRPPPNPTTTT